jgi:transposase, IS5 family
VAISAKGDPLEAIKKIVPWEDFGADFEAVAETKPTERKSNAGRKPYDRSSSSRLWCCSRSTNLSDEQTEYLIRDRLSFMRLSRSGTRGSGAGCHHDLAVSGGVGTGWADRQAV